MATDVSSLIRVMNMYKDDRTAGNESSSPALVTRDLLGGSGGTGSEFVKNHNNYDNNNYIECQELDLDMQVPSGWEKRLDLQSGKVYLQRCYTSSSPSSSDHKQHQTNNQTVARLQDLNFPSSSPSSKPLFNLFDETILELKLDSSSSPPSNSSNYQKVCTLDKVKSALERAKNETNKKRLSSTSSTSSPSSPSWLNCNNSSLPLSPSYSYSYSSSSSSIKDPKDDQEIEENILFASAIAAGCPGCLCYVFVMKNNPKCPRCNSVVPLPAMKKPRIDLNI